MISSFHHDVDEMCALLGYHAEWSCNPLVTFGTMYGSYRCADMLVKDYHSTLHDTLEERRSHLLSSSSYKLCHLPYICGLGVRTHFVFWKLCRFHF
jgi:hypothetical protein